jgi:hypothetical protein
MKQHKSRLHKIISNNSKGLFLASANAKFTLFVISSLYLCLKVNGYRAGTWDHWVLSPRGIFWSDGTSFLNDWTIFNAPQPHVFFDLLTALGSNFNALKWIYLGYFILTIVTLCKAYWIFIGVFVNRNSLSTGVFAVLILSLSPKYFLGTGVPFLGIALPALLGASLAILSLAYLTINKVGLAIALTIPTTIIHVQLGLALCSILILFSIFERNKWQRGFLLNCLMLLSSIICGVILLNLRPVYGELKDFTWVCENMIPYHCDANSWSAKTFIIGTSSLGLLLISTFISDNRVWRLIIRSLCLIEFVAVFSDFFNILFLGEFVQGSNIYRYGMFASALTPIAVVILFSSTNKNNYRLIILNFLGYFFLYFYLSSEFTVLADEKLLTSLFLLAAYLIKLTYEKSKFLISKNDNSRINIVLLSTLSILLFVTFTSFPNSHIQINLESETSLRSVILRNSIPTGAVIAADPRMTWLRLDSRRAVVVDCKYAPYGGPALQEYRQRMSSLGGWTRACTGESFQTLSSRELDSFARRYGADFILMESLPEFENTLMQFGWKVKTIIPQTKNHSSSPTKELILYTLQ